MKNELYDILNGFNSKTQAYKYFKLNNNQKGIKKLNEIADSVGFDLNIYNDRRKRKIKYCLVCNKQLNKHQNKFCSHSCSAKYSNSNRKHSEETKNKISVKLTKPNKKRKKKCTKCGSYKCDNIEVCNHTVQWFKGIEPFGFNINTLGTKEIYCEFYRIKDLLNKEYHDNGLSPKDIKIKYDYNKSHENILHILKSYNIKTRNLSESETNAYLKGKIRTVFDNKSKYQFNHGWHETWDNKKIYYRSSYELMFAKELDDKKIYYEVEFFRLKYWDTIKKKYRVAIPDFYIPSENKIVEVKSKVTFNKQNLIDKFNEYQKIGFNVLLYYENDFYTFNDLMKLNEHEYIL